jgi:bifunctional UDP-N-acetylglucosamine pyrophosphorylase / glucosamine-1-phosphate N-acetyltransferase
MTDIAAVVMAGGLGTRMKSAVPKHLHDLLGRRVVDWVLDAARELGADPLVVVASPETSNAYEGVSVAVQQDARGTGDAVAAARDTLAGHTGSVLILDAAAPLLTPALLEDLVAAHRRERADVTVLTIELDEPLPYGRIVRGDGGSVQAIVEERDATPEERAIRELNTSIYVFEADALWRALEKLDARNAQGELYLTDAVRHIVEGGGRAAALRAGDAREAIGINNRVELAVAARALRDRINERHMLAGVTIVDPESTWISADVELEPDVVVHPFTVLRGRTTIAAGTEIGPHVVAIDAQIGERVVIGPFCYLRPGTVLEPDAKAGTFVEIKNSRIGARTKVPHLSYLGDAEVGEDTNVAAGNITVNFPHEEGRPKGRTTIGKNVRTGVQNAFVAPVTVGDDAWIAAGSVITKDVPPGALAVARARQENKEGYARRERDD